jgi:hypothetical protein
MMSKEIDLDKPLSDEDREWLHARSQDSVIEANDRQFKDEGEDDEPEVDEDGGQEFKTTAAPQSWEPGTAPTHQFVQRPYDPPVEGAVVKGELVTEETIAAQEAAASGEEVEADDDLDTWTVDELKDELRAHGESTSGNKEELIKRLRKG